MSKQDRQGSRTPADLERRYNLGGLRGAYSELLGISSDTRDSVDRIDSELRNELEQRVTSLTRDTERIIMAALESYVETAEYGEFQQTIQSELLVMAQQISMTFSEATEKIGDVNGDLQSVVELLQKHFEFTLDGLLIKAGEDAMQLLLDNDIVHFMKGGQAFGWWDGVNFHTGNIFVGVDEIAQFGNYGFVPYEDDDSDGLDFVRVGG
jgi:hypothetical protein